jgi:hypothetical protein
MQQVYAARDVMDAHFVQGLLAEAGIEAVVEGDLLPEPTGVALPTVWVRDRDVSAAEPIIEEYVQREATRQDEPEAEATVRTVWTCPTCGEQIEEQFTNCWKCGAARPGTEGPTAGPPADPPLKESTPPPLPPTI